MISSMTAFSVSVKRCGDESGVEAVRDSVGGVLRFNSFARVIISSLFMTPFCSSNSPRAASSYVVDRHFD